MTKAYVTIAVDIDTTNIPVQTGLGESSNPQHVSRSHAVQAKRDHVWDVVHSWLWSKEGFIQVDDIRFPKGEPT